MNVTPEVKKAVAISDAASTHLGIATLTLRNRDSLDFYDLSVANIKRALEAAFEAGQRYEREANPWKRQLTLEEFRATKREVEDAQEALGFLCLPDGELMPAYVYADSCYVCLLEAEGEYLVTIENREWLRKGESGLAELEEILYSNWYVFQPA